LVQRYFEKFPLTEYTSSVAVDITKRTGLLDKVSSNPLVFYPYELDSYERPDQLSYRYYDDQYKSWLVYLTNKIVDPYYEWYLTDEEFERFIVKKYGSLEYARKKIKFYRNDWVDKPSITVSNYNALTSKQKTFWKPVYGFNNTISAYERKQEDWIINTNKLISYKVSNTSFQLGEMCVIQYNAFNQGFGQVDYVSSANGSIFLNNVTGTYFLQTPAETIVRDTSSESFTGDGVTTTFSLVAPITNQNSCIITVDGLVQVPGLHFTISNNILEFTDAPVNNAFIEYRNIEIPSETYESLVFTGNGSKTGFGLTSRCDSAENLLVTVDGLIQLPSQDYILSSGQVKFAVPPVLNSTIEVRNIQFEYMVTSSQVTAADGSTLSFSQNNIIVNESDVFVTVDGLLQSPGHHYIASNYSVIFASAPVIGSVIEFRNIIKKTDVKGYIYGMQSGTNTAFTSMQYQANNISDDVEVYYKPITMYEYELERNEYNKSIRLLDNRYAGQMANELEELMSE